MKNSAMITLCAALVLSGLVFLSCGDGAEAGGGRTAADGLIGSEWLLLEVKSPGETLRVDREKSGAANMYTISFKDGTINGTAAINLYSGPYTAASDKALSFGIIVMTEMAPMNEQENFKEYEYFAYLSGVNRWDIREGNLELYSVNGGGTEAVLIFTPR